MQFSCESCKTQLQIADEKVRGKRLIVRCKRCGAKIGISDPALGARAARPAHAASAPPAARASAPPKAAPAAAPQRERDSDTESTRAMDGDLLEQALQASRADEASGPPAAVAAPGDAPQPASSDAAEWFAMLHGKQAGPMSLRDLAARTDEGAVGPRTYLWKDGMDAWHRAKDLPELQHLFPSLPEAPLPPPPVAAPAPKALREFSTPDFVAPAAKSEPAPVEKPAVAVARPAAEKPQVGAAAHAASAPAAKPEDRPNVSSLPFGDLVEPEGVGQQLFTSDSDSQKTPPDLVNWAAAELEKKSAPPRPLVSTARMFEGAAPPRDRRSPFLFIVVGLLALAALVTWIAFGGGSAAAPPPPENAKKPEAKSSPAPATSVTTVPAKPDNPAPPPAASKPPPGKPAAETTGLTADQVRRKLDENKGALQTCIDEALRRDPNLRVGKIHIATTIAPSGQVTAAKIDKSTVDQSPLGACLRRATRRIAFPTFSGEAFDVDIPIVVTAGE